LNGQFGRLALTLLLSLTLERSAGAETVAQTVRKWGLIGSWALDCSLKPSRDQNAVLDYEIAGDGRVLYRRNFGDSSDENEVVSAELARDGLLNLRVYFPSLKQTREYGLMLQPDGAMRAIYNRTLKDEYTIRDGKFVGDRKPTPSHHRCK
jgi:hypothetical protein